MSCALKLNDILLRSMLVISRKIFFSFLITFALLLLPITLVLAAPYGSTQYGTGPYGSGDNTPPLSFDLDRPADNAITADELPTFRWKKTTDESSSISKYQVIVDDVVIIDNIPPNQESDDDYFREDDDKWIRYDGDHIEAKAKKDEHKLSSGARRWRVRTIDGVGNERNSDSRTLNVDFSHPVLVLTKIDNREVSLTTSTVADTAFVADTQPEMRGIASANSSLKIMLSLDGTETARCESTVAADSSWSCTFENAVASGRYNLQIQATGPNGRTTNLPAAYLVIGSRIFPTQVTDQSTTPLTTKPTQTTEVADDEQLVDSEEDEEEEETEEQAQPATYDVKVKVVDTKNNPVQGAKVTLFSTPREATTDAEGIAVFKDVEKGEHKVVIAYNDQVGEQAVSLDGQVAEHAFTIEIAPTNPFGSWQVRVVLGLVGLLVIGLLIWIFFLRRR